MSEQERIDPMSGEPVEVDGIYENEWGREERFNRGEVFPADPQLGTTTWKLVGLTSDTNTGWAPDSRFREEFNVTDGHKQRLHVERGDR